MSTRDHQLRAVGTATSLALALNGGVAVAQTSGYNMPSKPGTTSATGTNAPSAHAATRGEDAKDAMDHVNDAVKVIHGMHADPGARQLLDQAKGVFIIPAYGRAALGVGGRGGAGVLMVKQGGRWGNPAFYNYGGISAGLQAGAEGGAIVFVLNDDKAINSFTKQDNNWSLNAEAGLTNVAWSGKGQGSAGKGDVTVWSDTKGLFGDLAVSLTDMNFDQAETGAYYGHKIASARDVVDGSITNLHANALRQALASAASTPTPTASATSTPKK